MFIQPHWLWNNINIHEKTNICREQAKISRKRH